MIPRETPPHCGRFIPIERSEGVGKTTEAQRLAAHLTIPGQDLVLTREPVGTWLGERLRELVGEDEPKPAFERTTR